ncbi:hypothetical protein [Paraclostridium bifermentans]|uniref:hypothetical protein n=1 Tax=Paraclostridium bifermentans TaxID=1490 RepID=UPI00117D5BC1|nr:hypothetical protein [Paraclostridium bifermentans]
MENVIKPNWDNFKAKFNENPQFNFEWFCYLLFCKEYNKHTGIHRYKNQTGIETDTIKVEEDVIGWQAKFYESTLSSYKAEIIETLKKSKRCYKDITTLIFYTNQEWGQRRQKSTETNMGNEPKSKKEIESIANELGIDIIWKTASFFESPFVSIQNKDISAHFFCLEDSIIDQINKYIIPRIDELNEQYKRSFTPIGGKFISRNEVTSCISNIEIGRSIIIHGKAGQGKSGCTQGIISYCESNKIPYLAIKLDDRMPNGNIDKWSEELGLPLSIDKAINAISEDESGVIILDQLDALRWTQSHSRQALIICSEIIKRINDINEKRNKNISIVFVCRTYDYENDNNIRSLFNTKEDKVYSIQWREVIVKNLDEVVVKNIVGFKYDNLSIKMKKILSIPSNLYIWEHLDQSSIYDDYSTANQLIQAWWNQLLEKCIENQIDELEIENTKQEILGKIDRQGILYVSCKILKVTRKSLIYLSSSGFINLVNERVSFAHQSISDYFFAQEMLRKYFEGEDIIKIIGDKKKQTPQKRYQVQMLLQDIQSLDDEKFIEIGIQMLKSTEIRFYIKYVFLEVLGQSTNISEPIKKFVLECLEDSNLKNHIIDTVINGHTLFIDILIEEGILDKWIKSYDMKENVIDLFISVRSNYTEKEIQFIRNYLLNSKEYANKLSRCFSFDIHEDTDNVFELRIEFYSKYPEFLGSYMDFKELFKSCELRSVKILELMLKNSLSVKTISYNQERFLDENDELFIKNPEIVLKTLLKYIPQIKDDDYYSKWKDKGYNDSSIERTCVEIIKKTNIALIKKNPQEFMKIYNNYIGKDYTVFNEIILSGFEKLPIDFSDEVMYHISKNFRNVVFDESSMEDNELNIAKRVIKKHSINCKDSTFKEVEKIIAYYIDEEAKDRYIRRIEYNRCEYRENNVYWSFWGDLQMELLPCLPENRISTRTKNLSEVLKRRFKNGTDRYKKSLTSKCGSVVSPIAGKQLSNKQWVNILTNKKITNRRKSKWIEGVFIESSIYDFSCSFRDAVSLDPERFINLILSIDGDISIEYTDSLFSGVSCSDNLNNVPSNLLEKMILKYGYDYKSHRARYICDILSKKSDAEWSLDIISVLNDIGVNHTNPNDDKPNVTTQNDDKMKSFEMLQSNALNCVRGSAAEAIGSLLWYKKDLYIQLRSAVEKLCEDVNPAVKLASLQALYPIYNIDREFSKSKIVKLLEEDYRISGNRRMRNMFFKIYQDHSKSVNKAILKCYKSDDKSLIRIASYTIAEMYIRHRRYEDLILGVCEINESQAKYMVEMALLYFNKKEYNEISKSLIKRCITENFDLEFPLNRLFYDNLIDLERDKEFLIEIMKSNSGMHIISSFVKYLEANAKSIIEYKDIILTLSWSIVKNYSQLIDYRWGVDNELSKLIIALYDESFEYTSSELRLVSDQCLEIWDFMFENRIGSARVLTQYMLDR